MSGTSGEVALVGLTKRYGTTEAVRGIDLRIRGGEFFSLLGPSGCGKTTTLRMIAGLEEPSGGGILLDGVDVARTPPNRRPVNTVFQSYALFPFMDVAANVAFGLRYAKINRAQTKERVSRALALVRMSDYAARRPAQLSGGQQQRVALARALVLDPKVLLLDEPLGALDAQLRRTLQTELKALQERVGITFIYVTHDQEEALTMSDRLAVMSEGRIRQVGTPRALYEEPADAGVAAFLGSSNILGVTVAGREESGDVTVVWLGESTVRASGAAETTLAAGAKASVLIRPERVVLTPAADVGAAGRGPDRLPGMVERLVYLGATTHVAVRLPTGESLAVAVTNAGGSALVAADLAHGTPVSVHLPPDAVRLLPSDADDPGAQALEAAAP